MEGKAGVHLSSHHELSHVAVDNRAGNYQLCNNASRELMVNRPLIGCSFYEGIQLYDEVSTHSYHNTSRLCRWAIRNIL